MRVGEPITVALDAYEDLAESALRAAEEELAAWAAGSPFARVWRAPNLPTGAAGMIAAGATLMLVLALAMVLVVASSLSLLDRTRWFLLVLALIASILAALLLEGSYDRGRSPPAAA